MISEKAKIKFKSDYGRDYPEDNHYLLLKLKKERKFFDNYGFYRLEKQKIPFTSCDETKDIDSESGWENNKTS